MKKHLPTIAGILLGLCFLLPGVIGLFNLVAPPKMPEGTPPAHFMAAFGPTGYAKFVSLFQFVGGLMALVPRLRNIALLLLGPVIVNIIAYHTFVEDPHHLLNPLFIIIAICALFLLWNARSKFAGLLN